MNKKIVAIVKRFWKKRWKTAAGIAGMLISQAIKNKLITFGVDEQTATTVTDDVLNMVGVGSGALAAYGLYYRNNENTKELQEKIDILTEEISQLKTPSSE